MNNTHSYSYIWLIVQMLFIFDAICVSEKNKYKLNFCLNKSFASTKNKMNDIASKQKRIYIVHELIRRFLRSRILFLCRM